MFIILTPYILRQTHVSVDKYTIGAAIFYTGLGYCFTVSTKLTTAANAVILQYTAPFYIIILSGLFLHEKVYKIDFINISFVFCGILLFFVDEVGGGSFEADLGGHVLKKRVPFPGQGKRGSGRTIICFKKDDRAIFVHGFAKTKQPPT